MLSLNNKYQPLFNSDGRYYVITGGRGSGKSYGVNVFLLMLTYESGHVILFTRYTLISAHISIIPEFIEKIELLGLESHFHITKDEIINLQTGSKILFKGIKTSSGTQTANLKSLASVTTWVLDEAEELVDEDIFDKIDLSIRAKHKQNRVILVLNPATKEHFIYQKFFEGKGITEGSNTTKEDTTYIHTTYLDNIDNLSNSFILQIEDTKKRRPEKYKHVILGGWLDKAEGVVFDNWTFGEFNPNNLQTSCGMDFGFSIDPDTLTEVAIDKDKKKLYVKEHIYQNGIKTHQLAPMVLSKVGKKATTKNHVQCVWGDAFESIKSVEDNKYDKIYVDLNDDQYCIDLAAKNIKSLKRILKPNGTITAQVGSQDKKPKQVDKWLNLFEKSFGNTSLDRIYIPSFDCSWNFASSLNK